MHVTQLVTTITIFSILPKNYLVFWYSLHRYQYKLTFPKGESFWQSWEEKGMCDHECKFWMLNAVPKNASHCLFSWGHYFEVWPWNTYGSGVHHGNQSLLNNTVGTSFPTCRNWLLPSAVVSAVVADYLYDILYIIEIAQGIIVGGQIKIMKELFA